jgi:hypothetical protein
MSIAFLCLSYTGMNPALRDAKLPNVFLNVKETTNESPNVSKEESTSTERSEVRVSKGRYPSNTYSFYTKWGDPSLVEATLSLLKEALKEKHAWFQLISHDAYPLKTYAEMVDFLETQTKSMFDLVEEDGLVFKTSQWWCLTRADAELLVSHEDAFKAYLKKVPFGKGAWDELYFLSCLKHANPVYTYTPFKSVYTEWLIHGNQKGPVQKHPITFGRRLSMDTFDNSFFVRKTTLAFTDKVYTPKKSLTIQVYGTQSGATSSSPSINSVSDSDLVLVSMVSNDKIPSDLLAKVIRVYFTFHTYVHETMVEVLKQFPTHLWKEIWIQDEKGVRTRYVPPKVALLFLTIHDHHQPEIWTEYLKKTDKFSIYAHPKINKIQTPWLRAAVIPKRAKTGWGHITEAYYRLLEEALKDPVNMKFMFLSESCIPLKSFDAFYQKVILEDATLKKSYVKLMPISGYDRKERIETQKGHESISFIKHYARMCLSRADAEKVMENSLRGRKMRAFFNGMHVGDEFFLSGITQDHFEDFEMTYDNWDDTRMRAKRLHEEIAELRKLEQTVRTEELIRRKEAEMKVVNNNPKTYTSITGSELDVAVNRESFFWRKFMPGPLPWTSAVLRLETRKRMPLRPSSRPVPKPIKSNKSKTLKFNSKV